MRQQVLREPQAQIVLQHNADDAKHRAAERVRIF
jgi:hypothetical protein